MFSSAITGLTTQLFLQTQLDLQVHQAQEGIPTQPTQLTQLAQQSGQAIQAHLSNPNLGANINIFA